MTGAARRRLDRALVDRGLADNRTGAVALIERGVVLVSGSLADKPSRLVGGSEPIEVLGPPPRFVSRGGEKLSAALDRFGIDPRGYRVLDAGASTGGFTDCLLQAGASTVYAVDVGHGQLHDRLRIDRRVVVHERTDIRGVSLATIGTEPVDMVAADLSFISLRRVAPVLVGELVLPGAPLVALVKPQFEAGRVDASRGRGVIRDPEIHRRTLRGVADALTAAGADIMGAMPSPLTGSAGNIEFLLHARTARSRRARAAPPGARSEPSDLDELLDRALAEAARRPEDVRTGPWR